MTRDEAIEKLRTAQPRIDTVGNAALWISAFESLGMLTLDAPKGAHQRMVEACRALDLSGRTIDLVATALDNCGLVVVEK